MVTRQTRTFLGPVRVGKNKVNLGKALVIVEFLNETPTNATVFFLNWRQRHKYEMDLLDAHEFMLKTPGKDVSIAFRKSSNTLSIGGQSAPISTSVEISTMSISEETWLPTREQKKKHSSTTVTAYLSPICFLEHYVESFQYKASQNLEHIRKMSDEYSIQLKSVGDGCLITPWLVPFQPEVGKTLTLEPRNMIVFQVRGGKTPANILKRLNAKLDMLARIIGFLDNRNHEYSHIEISLESTKKLSSFNQWRIHQPAKKGCPSVAYKVPDYIQTVDRMYEELTNMKNEHRHKMIVAMRRFLKASEQSDISIRVALYDVALSHVLTVLADRRISLYPSSRVESILNAHGVSLNKDDLNAITLFHQIRNRIFKEIEPDFKYTNDVFKTVNRVLLVGAKILAAAFKLDTKGQEVMTHAIWSHHLYPVRNS